MPLTTQVHDESESVIQQLRSDDGDSRAILVGTSLSGISVVTAVENGKSVTVAVPSGDVLEAAVEADVLLARTYRRHNPPEPQEFEPEPDDFNIDEYLEDTFKELTDKQKRDRRKEALPGGVTTPPLPE